MAGVDGRDGRARGPLRHGLGRRERRRVGGEVEVDGAIGRRRGEMDRPAHRRRHAGRLDLEARLDQRPEQRRVVDDLVGIAGPHAALDDTGDDDQRDVFLRRVGDAVDGVGEPRPERGDEQARGAAERRRAGGHHRRRRLVAGEHEADVGAGQRVDERHHLAAGHAEGEADPVGCERRRRDVGDPAHAARLPSRQRTTAAVTTPKMMWPTSEAQVSVMKPRKGGRPAIRCAIT